MTNHTKARAEARAARAEAFAARYGGRPEHPRPRSERDRQAFHAGLATVRERATEATMVMSPWTGRLLHVLEYPAHVEDQRQNMAAYFATFVSGEGIEAAAAAVTGAGHADAAEAQVAVGAGV